MATNVKREGGKVRIEGVPDATLGIQWDMLVRAVQALLRSRGQEVAFEDLLACSGDAFNLCHGSRWQGVAYLCVPTDTVQNMAQAYGYGYECICDGYREEKMARLERNERLKITQNALDRIWAEVDAGRPVLVGGTEQHCGSWTIVVGYDRENLLMCHVGDGKPYRWSKIRGVTPGSPDEGFAHMDGRFRGAIRKGFVGGWQCNPAFLIKARVGQPSDEKSRMANALKRAVELHTAPKQHIGWWGGIDYYFGSEAYAQWARELHELDYPADLKKELPKDAYDWYEMGNMDTQVDQIARGRTAAAAFCRRAMEVFPQAKVHLAAAADLYGQEIAIARQAFAPFIPPFDGNDGPRKAWLSSETEREAGVAAINRMLEKEKTAILEIEKALALFQ